MTFTKTKLAALVLLATALAAPAPAQNVDSTGQPAKIVAVVIGISKYAKLGGGQQLQFADRDALLVADALKRAGVARDNIRILTGPEASLAAMKSAIGNWLAHIAGPNDTAIIFYSGHGFYEPDFSEAYFLGSDSDPKEPFATALALGEIGQALARRVRAGRVLLLADAIRKDFFDPDTNGSAAAQFIKSLGQLAATRAGISAIAASGPNEFSREGQRWGGQGVFANHLAQILTPGTYGNPDRNNDGIITADELAATLSARVADDTANKQHVWHSDTALAQIALVNSPHSNAPGAVANNGPASGPPALPASPTGTATQPMKPTTVTPAPETHPAATQAPATRNVEQAKVAAAAPASRVQPAKPENTPAGVPDKQPAPSVKSPATAPAPIGPAPSSSTHVSTAARPDAPSRGEIVPRTEPAAESRPVKPETSARTSPPSIPRTPSISSVEPAGRRSGGAAEPLPSEPSTPAPPRPGLPRVGELPDAAARSPESSSQPAAIPAGDTTGNLGPAPSPLTLQLEAAIAARNLLEPKNSSAWDIYQKLAADPATASDAARLRPVLAEALREAGRAIVAGEVCSDTISDRVDDFRRAGQMLARARSLKSDSPDTSVLEKLSAAEALIALQFFDEAERALSPLQTARVAAVENAMGLLLQGRLDNFRAERAFKRAMEIDPNWAAPHYNLGLLFRSQQNEAALPEFERAASLDAASVTVLTALGDEYFARKDWPRAAEQYRRAIKLRPNDDGLHTKLGHALFSQGLQEEANREYQKALELRGRRQ